MRNVIYMIVLCHFFIPLIYANDIPLDSLLSGNIQINNDLRRDIKVDDWQYFNQYLEGIDSSKRSQTNFYYTRIWRDLNRDSIPELILVGTYNTKGDTVPRVYFAIVQLVNNREYTVEFLQKTESTMGAIYSPPNIEPSYVVFMTSSKPEDWLIVRWRNGRYQIDNSQMSDEPPSASISIQFQQNPHDSLCVFYILQQRGSVRYWGYSPFHRSLNSTWNIITPAELHTSSVVQIDAPLNLYDWPNIFQNFDEVHLLLLKLSTLTDSLVEKLRTLPQEEYSAREILQKIPLSITVKKWNLTLEYIESKMGGLSYP